MMDNIINVNFTAKQKRKAKLKKYITGIHKKFKKLFTLKNKPLKKSLNNKDNYHKTM